MGGGRGHKTSKKRTKIEKWLWKLNVNASPSIILRLELLRRKAKL